MKSNNGKEVKSYKSLVSIIEIGLKYWIEKKCHSINGLDIKIKASLLNVIQGRVKEVNLLANEVNFNNIIINRIYIKAENISLMLNLKEVIPRVELSDKFKIEGDLALCDKGLNETLTSNSWSRIGDWLTKEFLPGYQFKEILLSESFIIVKALNIRSNKTLEKHLSIISKDGKLFLKDRDSAKNSVFPMDPSIYIKDVIIKDRKLCLSFSSQVDL